MEYGYARASTNSDKQDIGRQRRELVASGMTDYQWCIAHNIKPGTFYNWIKRLRQSGSMDTCQAGHRRDTFKAFFYCECMKVFL